MPAPKGNTFAKNNKGGRPTKFTDDILAYAQNYIGSCIDTKDAVSLPMIEGLARWLNVSRDTVNNWGKANEEFFAILENIRAEQAKRLINNGLSGKYNPTIAKLILSAKHGFVEETKTDITSGGEKLTITGMAVKKE